MASANGRLLLPVRIFISTPLLPLGLPARCPAAIGRQKNRHPDQDQGAKKRAECNSGMTGWQWPWRTRPCVVKLLVNNDITSISPSLFPLPQVGGGSGWGLLYQAMIESSRPIAPTPNPPPPRGRAIAYEHRALISPPPKWGRSRRGKLRFGGRQSSLASATSILPHAGGGGTGPCRPYAIALPRGRGP
jgi:hypothetical protein